MKVWKRSRLVLRRRKTTLLWETESHGGDRSAWDARIVIRLAGRLLKKCLPSR